jgi:hypothetical protein
VRPCRQSVPFAYSIFHLDTIAALEALAAKQPEVQGTVNFLKIVNEWWEMSNVKNPTKGIRTRLETARPWTTGNAQERCDFMTAVADFIVRWEDMARERPGAAADRTVKWGLSRDTAWAWRQQCNAMV